MGQCTPNMHANLEALGTFIEMEATADLLELLKGVKSLVFNFEQTKSLPDALVGATDNLYKFRHPESMKDG